MASHDDVEPKKLLYEWKSPKRSELCEILNENDHWEELAAQMKFGVSIIHKLKRRKNPTKELLEEWSHDNHTIEELFLLLSSMNHRQAMIRLKPFVPEEYHRLIYKDDTYSNGIGNCTPQKDLKIEPQNFRQIQPSPINNQKVFFDKKFGEEKILNAPPLDDMVSIKNHSPSLQTVVGSSKINNEDNFYFVDTTPPEISYEELTQATDNWSSRNILGKGCFGTVFKGTWQKTKVAIRTIQQPRPEITELMVLRSYRHDNILTLEGFSVEPEVTCLVYRLMANGSLEDCLLTKERNKHLTWLQRREIAKGTARGLQFLHTVSNKPLVHGDIKSANIFLDKNFEPKIEEVGLGRNAPGKNSMKTSASSTKSDTYAFGLVLFELATGLPAYDDARPEIKYLKELIDDCRPEHLPFFKDEKAGMKNTQVFEELITLGKWCTQILFENRPEMVEVFRKIDEL